jgi:hypothetical protein
MAKVKGLLHFTGTLHGLNFYMRKGVPIARAAGGGFNGNAIKNHPSMVRVRENGSEFKGCMQDVKYFKQSLAPFLTQIKDGELHQRIVRLFTQIKSCDAVSERGKRNVGSGLQTIAGKACLEHAVLTAGTSLQGILHQPYRFDFVTGLQLMDFDGSLLDFPGGATHLKLSVGFLKFDFDHSTYKLVVSASVYLDSDSSGAYLLGPLEANPENGTAVGVVFAHYVQQVNGVYYPLQQVSDVVLEVVYVG